MRILRRLVREQDGAALVVATGTLMVAATLTAVALATTSEVSGTSTRDGNGKRALGAAEAGLNVALHRLDRIAANSPSATFVDNCVTDREVAWSSATQCPAATGQLGNGASYQYYVTPSLDSTQAGISTVRGVCGAGLAGERCITAIGTVNGVTRRIQVRAVAESPFALNGIIGLQKVTIDSPQNWNGPNYWVRSDLGSNGDITIGNNTTGPLAPWNCYLGPGATMANINNCNLVRLAQPLAVLPVDRFPFAVSATANSNSTIPAGFGYSSPNRMLAVPGNKDLVLASGDYNFCEIQMANNATLRAATGARVRIYVDSPARPGSGCPGGSGRVNANNAASIFNPSPAGQLEIYQYGTSVPTPAGAPPPPTTCNNDFTYKNGLTGTAASNFYLYAPNSVVDITTSSPMGGAITGCRVHLYGLSTNTEFNYLDPITQIYGHAAAVKGSWRECVAPTPVSGGVPQPYGTCKG